MRAWVSEVENLEITVIRAGGTEHPADDVADESVITHLAAIALLVNGLSYHDLASELVIARSGLLREP